MITQGKWVDDGYGSVKCETGDKSLLIASVSVMRRDEFMDNTKLIAAAPEMYEALKALFAEPFIKEYYESHKNKDLAFGEEVPGYLTDCDKICEPFDKCIAAIARVEQ